MAVRFTLSLRDARLQKIIDAIGASGKVEIYTGTQPAVAGQAPTGVLLGTLDLSAVAGTIAGGVLTMNTITPDVNADDNGYATWGRITKNDGTFVMDFDCGTENSLASLKFTDTLFSQGDTIDIKSFTLTEGNA